MVHKMQMNRTFARGKDPMYPGMYRLYGFLSFEVQRARKAFQKNCFISVDGKSLFYR